MASQQNAGEQLMQMMTGYWVSRSLQVAAKLGIPDMLQDRPLTAAEIAAEQNLHELSVYRLMRALSGVSLFEEDEDGRFHLTELSEMLTSDHPNSLRKLAIVFGEETYRSWVELAHSLKTGETGFRRVFGEDLFPYLEQNPEIGRDFGEAMTDYVGQIHQGVLQTYDFGDTQVLADIGGSHGTLLSLLMRRYSHLRGILFDQQHVIDNAQGIMAPDLLERCELVAGDFFEAVPAGADTYILSSIVHDWDEPRILRLLGNIHDVIPEDGKLLIVETVLKERNQPDFGKLMDLTMLAVTGGRERTAAEYETLLAQANFRVTNVISTQSPGSIVEAVPS